MRNPALRQEPRYEPASVIPLKQEPSLLEWLQSNQRIIAREVKDTYEFGNDEEISELMDGEDDSYLDDDDDFDLED